MKFTLSWLKDHLDTDADLDTIVETMVKIGLEVEEVENPAERLAAITVGHVVHAEKHPDADKLKLCRVETRDGEMQIVCGAPNAREGIKVAFAPVGTYIPGIDVTLSKAKIRGVESLGMMCSARELELGDDHDGIIELPEGCAVGTPLSDVLDLNDPVIDFEVTPNRPDTNGVDGVARDLAAAGLGTLITPAPASNEGEFDQPIPVAIDNTDACPAFGACVIRGVKNGPSPKWLQDRLRAIGLRPINALVDITNYVSYDRARPLHVYDANTLTGTIRARMGVSGERFQALDSKEYEVDETMCVIADDRAVLGLGGIMGGEETGSTEGTTDVLVECALFDPLMTARTGRKTGIVSDARYRFERGVDPASVQTGLDLATSLILEICGGTASTQTIVGSTEVTPLSISFPPADVERLTGMTLPDSEKEGILQALGFDVTRGGLWEVTAPSFRPDIEGKADLVEEIARIHGLEHLPALSMTALPGEHRPEPSLQQRRERQLRETMRSAGYPEAITWAFCDGEVGALFGGQPDLILSNPISSDLNMMRPSALPNLLAAIGRNQARGATQARLFEVGGQYLSDAPDGQRTVLCAVAFGADTASWSGTDEAPGVFSAKALALTALSSIGVSTDNLSTYAQGPDYFHPGRKGALGLGPKLILAQFGELHPRILQTLDIAGPVMAVEIHLDAIPTPKGKSTKTKSPLKASNLMPLSRDFAFIVDDDTPAESLIKAVKGADKKLISDVSLFDVYSGTGVEDGKKSLALAVTIQPIDSTLTDKDIDLVSEKIIKQAQKATNATLRH